MKIPVPIPSEVQSQARLTFLALIARLENLRSWPKAKFADVAALPPPQNWDARTVIVLDIDGAGNPGFATALDSVWYDQDWSAL